MEAGHRPAHSVARELGRLGLWLQMCVCVWGCCVCVYGNPRATLLLTSLSS